YVPLVVAYDPATGTELGRAELPAVHLAGNSARPPRQAIEAQMGRPMHVVFGDVELLGATLPERAASFRPGERLPLALVWRARQALAGDRRIQLSLEGGSSVLLGEMSLGGDFPAAQWAAGQLVRQWPALQVPAAATPGIYHLHLRVLR